MKKLNLPEKKTSEFFVWGKKNFYLFSLMAKKNTFQNDQWWKKKSYKSGKKSSPVFMDKTFRKNILGIKWHEYIKMKKKIIEEKKDVFCSLLRASYWSIYSINLALCTVPDVKVHQGAFTIQWECVLAGQGSTGTYFCRLPNVEQWIQPKAWCIILDYLI